MRVKQERMRIMQPVQSCFHLRKRHSHLLRKHGILGCMAQSCDGPREFPSNSQFEFSELDHFHTRLLLISRTAAMGSLPEWQLLVTVD